MTTIEKIAAAEARVIAARTALEEVERPRFAISGHLDERRDDCWVAERAVENLRKQLAAEMEAQAARDQVEQGARKKLDAGAKQLDASTRGLADAVESVRAALEILHQKAEAHAVLVERWRYELSAIGLTGETRPDGVPHATTVLFRGLTIDGRRWIGFAPESVVAFAARAGAAPDHMLANRLRGVCGVDERHLAEALAPAKVPA